MTTSDVYSAPNSELSKKEEKSASFSSLNFWRKFYIVLIWLGSLLTSTLFIWAAVGSPELSIGFSVGFSLVILGVTYWHHHAIVSRNLTQITLLAILNLIPLANLIGCLIMVSIRRVTKKEREEYEIIEQ